MLHSHHKCDAAHDYRISTHFPQGWVFATVVRVTHVCSAVSPSSVMDVLCALSSAQLLSTLKLTVLHMLLGPW